MRSLRELPLLILLAACTGTPAAQPVTPPTTPAETPAAAETPAKDTPLTEQKVFEILAPSPLQLERSVRKAGLGDTMSGLVPTELPAMPPEDDKDSVALRTGVVFTYVLLSGRTMEKDRFVESVKSLRAGMATIGTGQGWLSEMDDAIVHVENDTASREDFLTELDAMVGSSVPEEGWGPGDTTGPLLQAGAWLTGINLMARAVVEANDAAAGDKLLKRPEVAEFFLRYIRSDKGAEKASMLSSKIAESLEELRTIASKETLDVEDAKKIVAVTDRIVAML